MALSERYFDELFADSDDPWAYRTRWYEARKRALTLASLPRERYALGFEPGCANGELSAVLAVRCETFIAADASDRPVQLATERLRRLDQVRVIRCRVPDQWPEGRFDLIVISEFGYYLEVAALDRLADRMRESLIDGGTILACHWRHPIQDCALVGDAVHRRLADGLSLPNQGSLVEPDFRIDVWVKAEGSA